ncbi:MAG: hypothetical protein ABL956_16220 [Hyphomonadaceae bacterium]
MTDSTGESSDKREDAPASSHSIATGGGALAMADLVAPQHWNYRPLFEHLAKHFDYILRIAENADQSWGVDVWNAPNVASVQQVGRTRDLGHLRDLSWTTTPLTLEEVTDTALKVSDALRCSGARFVFVFHPGKGWQSRLAHYRLLARASAPEGAA